jgi:hypothetical protein
MPTADGECWQEKRLSTPPNSNLAPPGWYMLFVVENHVPSIAQWISIGGDPANFRNYHPLNPGFKAQDVPGPGVTPQQCANSLNTDVADIAATRAKVIEDARLAKVASDERARRAREAAEERARLSREAEDERSRLLAEETAARLAAENLARQIVEEKRIADLREAGELAAAQAAERALSAQIAADKAAAEKLVADRAKLAKDLEDARLAKIAEEAKLAKEAADEAAALLIDEKTSTTVDSSGIKVVPFGFVMVLALSLLA